MTFRGMVVRLRREARAGTCLPFVVTYEDQLVGQLTVGGIAWGSFRSAHVGYWIDSAVAGRGIMPTALALAVDHCFRTVGLHRIEINIRPENSASLRVVEKLGFRDEGLRRSFLHIDGAWRDHRSFALTADELPAGGLVGRWRAIQSQESHSSQD
jgi:[ribosomal protein S5]-alanine N-acetyltransferase